MKSQVENITVPKRLYALAESPRVLIVEDDAAMAQMMAMLLKENWMDCVVRRSGAEGIHAFADEQFDLIITDLHMAAGDGIALIQKVRRTSYTPVIVVTGYAKEYAEHVRHLNNVAVISKPFETELLLETIDMALEAGSKGKWIEKRAGLPTEGGMEGLK